MKLKKGDTLVEVVLAVGIFSLVAVIIISVVNASTSSSQSALEITIAREEIDAQAEALRFIHSSFQIGDDQGASQADTTYNSLWKSIVSLAKDNPSAIEFNPSTCEEIYNNDGEYLKRNGAFILNTRNLNSKIPEKILYTAQKNSNKFIPAAAYPRMLYNYADKYSDTNSLISQGSSDTLDSFYGAEGIFVIPFKDPQNTVIVSNTGVPKKAAYYDFYIRSCWFGPGADRPSTISTVVRLYDPELVRF